MIDMTATKYSGNPIWQTTDDWDTNPNYLRIIKIGSRYHCWYDAFTINSFTPSGVGYKYSDDGMETWVKPSLGLHEFNGTTSNNLVFGNNTYGIGVYYDTDTTSFVATIDTYQGVSGTFVFTSTDGIHFTYLVKLSDWNTQKVESATGIWKLNGVWYIYCLHWSDLHRDIGVFSCSTLSANAGLWTDHGAVITASSANLQRYSIGLWNIDGTIYAGVSTYNKSTDRMEKIELYTTTDCVSFTLVESAWIVASSNTGAWDYGVVLNGTAVPVSNGYRYYYSGRNSTHDDAALPWHTNIGYATFGVIDIPDYSDTIPYLYTGSGMMVGGYGEAHTVTTQSNLKYFDGFTWNQKPLKVYSVSAWIEKSLKHFDGTTWV